MVITGLIISSGGIESIMTPFFLFLNPVFGLSHEGCFVLLSGLLCGYPMGARTCAEFTNDGRIPFEEAKFLQFNYSDDWKAEPLNHQYRDENGKLIVEQLEFYFEGGKKYTIELECVLGRLASELLAVDESLVRMNEYYRQILMITGPEPDTYTDYGFNQLIPEVMRGMRVEAENLRAVLARFEEIIGEKGEHSVLLERVAYTLEVMGNDETKVAANLSILKSYIGSIGTWLLQSRNQPLQMDYILVQGVDNKLPKGEAGFFSTIWFEIQSFFIASSTCSSMMLQRPVPVPTFAFDASVISSRHFAFASSSSPLSSIASATSERLE